MQSSAKDTKIPVIRFYGGSTCFSNFYVHDNPIIINGKSYTTMEHYFQAMKFLGNNASKASEAYAEQIRCVKTPSQARMLGRQKVQHRYASWENLNELIKNSLDNNVCIREDWDEIKDKIMYEGLAEKFTQDKTCTQALAYSDPAILIENSPRDSYWGCGANGKGKNKLGLLLMKLRDTFHNY